MGLFVHECVRHPIRVADFYVYLIFMDFPFSIIIIYLKKKTSDTISYELNVERIEALKANQTFSASFDRVS